MRWFYVLLVRWLDPVGGGALTEFSRVGFESWIPLWLLPFCVVGIVVGVYFLYGRSGGVVSQRKLVVLTVLRSLAYVLLLVCLAKPRLVIEGEGVLRGPVPVVLDGSQSMGIEDVDGEARVVRACGIAADLFEAGEEEGEVSMVGYWAGKVFGGYVPGDEVVADGAVTDLGGMLEEGVGRHVGGYVPGVVLLSDGADNGSQDLERSIGFLRKAKVPVYVCGVGSMEAEDVAVSAVVGEDVVFLSEKVKMYVNVEQHGYVNERVMLRVFLDDVEVYSGEHVLVKERESFPVEYKASKRGVFQLRAEVSPLPGEIMEENNVYVRTVRVIDEQLRVLLAFGEPSWEYRYLAGAFERDKRVDFKVFMPDVDGRVFSKGGGSFFTRVLPDTAEGLSKAYDVVFISRINMSDFPRSFVEALPDFVEGSGGLAVLSDPSLIPFSMEGTPVEGLLPIVLGRGAGRSYRDELFSPEGERVMFDLTDEGLASSLVLFSGVGEENRRIWRTLPPVYSFYKAGRLKPSAMSLLVAFKNDRDQAFPAIVQHSYGKGSVLFMAFDSTWRWRKEFGDRYFRGFWGRAVQELGLPHLLNEAAQSVILIGQQDGYAGEKVLVRARVSDGDYSPFLGDVVKMTVEEGAVRREVDMLPVAGRVGMYRMDYMPESPGLVRFELPRRFGARRVEFRVMRPQREFRGAGLNKGLLEGIARETGGAYFDGADAGGLLPALMANRPRHSIKVAASLWDSWFLFLLIIGVLTGEWVVRKSCYLD